MTVKQGDTEETIRSSCSSTIVKTITLMRYDCHSWSSLWCLLLIFSMVWLQGCLDCFFKDRQFMYLSIEVSFCQRKYSHDSFLPSYRSCHLGIDLIALLLLHNNCNLVLVIPLDYIPNLHKISLQLESLLKHVQDGVRNKVLHPVLLSVIWSQRYQAILLQSVVRTINWK